MSICKKCNKKVYKDFIEERHFKDDLIVEKTFVCDDCRERRLRKNQIFVLLLLYKNKQDLQFILNELEKTFELHRTYCYRVVDQIFKEGLIAKTIDKGVIKYFITPEGLNYLNAIMR